MQVIENQRSPEVDDDAMLLAKELRRLAAEIERGNVLACGIACVDKADFVTTFAHCPDRRFVLLGGLSHLAHRINKSIED